MIGGSRALLQAAFSKIFPRTTTNKVSTKSNRIVCHAIRHGESEYNLKLVESARLYGKENIHTINAQHLFQHSKALLDAPLTNHGKEQALQAADYFRKQQPIRLVFVSPLERTLETAWLAFSRVDQRPNFIVLPQITEIFSKICDISVGISSKKQRYSTMNFDMFMGKQLTWQSSMLNTEEKEEVQGLLGGDVAESELAIIEYYVQLLKKRFPDPMEPQSHFPARVNRAVSIIREISSEQGASEIALVSHRRILRELTKDAAKPEGVGLDNCEMITIVL